MQFFYDGQIRKYLTQIIRLMSGFSVQDGSGNLKSVPVTYGDLTRQVSSIMRENSENKLPTVPRISVYVTNLEIDRSRTSDASFVDKVNIRERAYDEEGQEYLNTQGKNYTVERLYPAPFNLSVNVDVWASNTEQKLQILEQILVLFRPSLELQTTDNYVDWTSLTVLHLTDIRWSSRTIPVGVDTEIDIGTMSFETPIFITPPAKVKKLGVITSVIANMWDEDKGTIDLGLSMPEMTAYEENLPPVENVVKNDSERSTVTRIDTSLGPRSTVPNTYRDYGVYIEGTVGQLIDGRNVGSINWRLPIESYPGTYVADVSEIRLRTASGFIAGTFTINPLDEYKININWDQDTLPTGDVIEGPARSTNSWTSFDKIIDPSVYNPTADKVSGFRVLTLEDINNSSSVGDPNYDGPDAWKNTDGSDFVAGANDVIEWDGANWNIVLDSSATTDSINQKNLTTGIIYKWSGSEWLQAFEGEYPVGTWEIYLDP
jgi:hypothetical protein